MTLFSFDPVLHEFKKDGVVVPSVTQVLAKAGIIAYSYVSEEIREYSMKRGTSVHWMLQLEDEGALNYRTVPKRLRGYRRAYTSWRERADFRPLKIEYQFVSDYGFAGIIDRIGVFTDKALLLTVVDLKTGPIAEWVRYQLAAYSVGIEPNLKKAKYIRRVALRVRDDGLYHVREFPMASFDTDWAKFYAALEKTNGNHD
jgi:hypothetical protein